MSNLTKLDSVKYKFERENIVPGRYTLHRPSKCNLKFPIDNRPIHKKKINAYEGKEVIEIPQNGKWRKMIIPAEKKNLYPAILPKSEYDRLKQQAKVISLEERLAAAQLAEDEEKRKIEESERRIQRLNERQRIQDELSEDVGFEPVKRDRAACTLKRAADLKNEEYQGPRIANQLILASKCHAIRDAQVSEKALIQKELKEEEQRLDMMMEQHRLAAIEREEKISEKQKAQRLKNIECIKQQIDENERLKLLEFERITKESAQLNQVSIALHLNEMEQSKKKRETSQKLKELLDKCNYELRCFKQMREEEDEIMNARIQNFMKQKHERDSKIRAEAQAAKFAKEKGVYTMAKAQKDKKDVQEELEQFRNLRIQEDVEREYRKRERDIAMKKQNDLKLLKEAREKQIEDIRKQTALEISRDEDIFNTVVRQNKEDIIKEEKMKRTRQEAIEKHRVIIRKQINEKERERIRLRQKMTDEGMAIKCEVERQDQLERDIIKQKVDEMRQQKIPEAYVTEVEQQLAKLKIYQQ